MRINPSEFKKLDLRAHTLLDDVPIHDVWRVELAPRDRDFDIQEIRTIFSERFLKSVNPAVKGLFALRKVLGRLFGWDQQPSNLSAESYVSRLTDQDRRQSLEPAGTPEGPFRILYVFPHEALAEVINKTVHAFSCVALVPNGDGYLFYWAIYVRPGTLLSRLYMAIIRPFRHRIVYPSILAHAQREWAHR